MTSSCSRHSTVVLLHAFLAMGACALPHRTSTPRCGSSSHDVHVDPAALADSQDVAWTRTRYAHRMSTPLGIVYVPSDDPNVFDFVLGEVNQRAGIWIAHERYSLEAVRRPGIATTYAELHVVQQRFFRERCRRPQWPWLFGVGLEQRPLTWYLTPATVDGRSAVLAIVLAGEDVPFDDFAFTQLHQTPEIGAFVYFIDDDSVQP